MQLPSQPERSSRLTSTRGADQLSKAQEVTRAREITAPAPARSSHVAEYAALGLGQAWNQTENV
jgi:hypothetical protein